jgi:hypothetical protein
MSQPDYLLLGHFTRDVLPDHSTTPGGTSLYAALTAHRLGQNVAIVSAEAELPPDWPAEIQVSFYPSQTPPTFENRYTSSGRQQILHATAEPLSLPVIPPQWRAAPIVHLGPVLGEIPESFVFAFPNALLGVTLQGWMRGWGSDLPTPIHYHPWNPSPEVLKQIDVLVLSIEDVYGDEALVTSYARYCRLVALTRGAKGATLFWEGQPYENPAFPAIERDPTGAGDVFAAALLIHFHQTGDPLTSARFAAAVAAASVEGEGVTHIPSRAEVERRLAGE